MFGFFAAFTGVGFIYYLLFLKDTTYKNIKVEGKNGEITI